MQLIATATEGANNDQASFSSPVVVIVDPVLDNVLLNSGTTTVVEDQVISLGADIDLTLVDVDGSQALSIIISGIPETVTPNHNTNLPGSITDLGAGVWQIDGTAQQSIDLLNSFTLTSTQHDDTNFQVSITAQTTEINGDMVTANSTQDVIIQAAADAPSLTVSSTPQGDEDTLVAVPIELSLVDNDGSESLDFVQISGVPASSTFTIVPSGSTSIVDLGEGEWEITGSDADIIATLAGGITIQPGQHLGDDIILTLTAQTSESNPTEAGDIAVSTAQTVLPVTIDIVPVADQPSVSGANYVTEEDTPVSLSGLAGELVDTDGSETHTFTLSSVPSGGSFASGTDLGGGIWLFTAEQLTTGLVFTPPLNAHGTYEMTLTSIATENENGSQAVATAPVSIVVDSQADDATISGVGNGNEDTSINFGSQLNVELSDTDGSETLTSITITMTNGEIPTYSDMSGGSVTNLGGGQYLITGSQVGIQATLDTFTVTPPLHSDADIPIVVSATTLDADGSTSSNSRNRNIRVRAVADTPGGTADDAIGIEDNAIVLNLSAIDSADTDGSEVTSVLLTGLPAGSSVTGIVGAGSISQQGDDWLIEAADITQLNAILGTIEYMPPPDFSGVIDAQMQVISTEAETGNQVADKTATFTDNFTITVSQTADAPILTIVDSVEGAAGFEDELIPLSIDVRLSDEDGSELLGDIIISDIPTGASLVDATGALVGTITGSGEVTIPVSALAGLHILPQQDSNEDFVLTVTASSIESAQGLIGDNDFDTSSGTLVVNVIGTADPAILSSISVNAIEDEPIAIGSAISASIGDADGSETLYFVINGLPDGIVPSAGSYIGGGWQVSAADLPGLTIPAPADFSGDFVAEYAPGLEVAAISQEDDGDQTLVTAQLTIIVEPVVDDLNWSPSVTVAEDNNIALLSAVPPALSDADSSEQIESYTFDFNNIIADAGISSNVLDVDDFINNFINGSFNDNQDGTITVAAENLSSVSLDAAAFFDSNRDFNIPFSLEISDTGLSVVTANIANSLVVNLVGVADEPTVFAEDYSGGTGEIIPINSSGTEFGGESTDTDDNQGQATSESVHYIVSNLNSDPNLQIAFVDATTGTLVGFNNNDGTWTLRPEDLTNIAIVSAPGTSGSVTLTLTTIATENDFDVATTSTNFDVDIAPGTGGGTVDVPLQPIVNVNPMSVDEDGSITLDIQVSFDPADPSNPPPTISVVLSGIPSDAGVEGAFYNPVNNSWVTDAATISSGGVIVTPAPDWSGTIDFEIDAIATNESLQEASTNDVPVQIEVVAVADGPNILFDTQGGNEDTGIPVSIGVSLLDTNGSQAEELVEPILVTVGNGASLSAGVDLGGGVYQLTLDQLSGLTVMPQTNNGDDIPITVEAVSIETSNGNTNSATFTGNVPINAVADAPETSAADSSGDEDTAIELTGLSAGLVDVDGSETLSIVLEGIPEGSILSAGSNNGDGSWTLTSAELSGLNLTPPANFSGAIGLTLTAFSIDDNGTRASSSSSFELTVSPVADSAVITTLPVGGDSGEAIALNLNIAPGDVNGSNDGESPPETTQVQLVGVEPGLIVTADGGIVTDIGDTIWVFEGTVEQANSLAIIADGIDGDFTIGVSVEMVDDTSVGTPVTGNINLSVHAVADQPLVGTTDGDVLTGAGGNDNLDGLEGDDVLVGNAGSDVINGGDGADIITGGIGADILTGGQDADTFVWDAIDILSASTDEITDFDTSSGDVLDVSAILPDFDTGSDVLSDFLNLSVQGSNTIVQVDQSGIANFTVSLVNLTDTSGLDLATLQSNGNLIV
ncbi:MAG: type I secretion C-terminal target domain-containing protein [Pseudomonadota bacterium]